METHQTLARAASPPSRPSPSLSVAARSDFDIRELRRKRMSIYIGPAPSDLTSYRSLIRLLVQQIYDASGASAKTLSSSPSRPRSLALRAAARSTFEKEFLRTSPAGASAVM